MPTRYTAPSHVGHGQEIVYDQVLNVPVGIRNVRALPQQNIVEGGFVNPNVSNWYYKNSFKIRVKRSWESENMPWLFGPGGLYPDIYDCENECDEDDPMCDPMCVCPCAPNNKK